MIAEHMQLVEDCMKREERLSAWEHDFIVSVAARLESGRDLSPKQAETLDQVWEKATRKGWP